jgi:hypothetical protein
MTRQKMDSATPDETDANFGTLPFTPEWPLWREFVVAVNDTDYCRHAGFALTSEYIIKSTIDNMNNVFEGLSEEERLEHMAEAGDFAIWEGRKLLAAIHATASGNYEVTRFDNRS